MSLHVQAIKPMLDKFLKEKNINKESVITEIGSAPYHGHTRIAIPNHGHFCIRGIESGCGGAIMYGNGTLVNSDITIEAMKLVFQYYKKAGVGMIITTLGQYYNNELLIKLGFVKLSIYSNYTHAIDGSYKQSLYQIIL